MRVSTRATPTPPSPAAAAAAAAGAGAPLAPALVNAMAASGSSMRAIQPSPSHQYLP
jgi:hypothetical protein